MFTRLCGYCCFERQVRLSCIVKLQLQCIAVDLLRPNCGMAGHNLAREARSDRDSFLFPFRYFSMASPIGFLVFSTAADCAPLHAQTAECCATSVTGTTTLWLVLWLIYWCFPCCISRHLELNRASIITFHSPKTEEISCVRHQIYNPKNLTQTTVFRWQSRNGRRLFLYRLL